MAVGREPGGLGVCGHQQLTVRIAECARERVAGERTVRAAVEDEVVRGGETLAEVGHERALVDRKRAAPVVHARKRERCGAALRAAARERQRLCLGERLLRDVVRHRLRPGRGRARHHVAGLRAADHARAHRRQGNRAARGIERVVLGVVQSGHAAIHARTVVTHARAVVRDDAGVDRGGATLVVGIALVAPEKIESITGNLRVRLGQFLLHRPAWRRHREHRCLPCDVESHVCAFGCGLKRRCSP